MFGTDMSWTISKRVIVFFALMLFGCQGEPVMMNHENLAKLDRVSSSALDKLSKKKIFFAHQSVGYNILSGIELVKKNNSEVGLKVSETRNADAMVAGTIAHATVGANLDPAVKVKDFAGLLKGGFGEKADLAFLKFCYLDILPGSDPEAVFTLYKSAVEELSAVYPKLTLIHFTIPLTSEQTGIKAILKKIMGKEVRGLKDNKLRAQYNNLLRNEYSMSAPVFDIAKIEATSPDGQLTEVEVEGKRYQAMYSGYTDDGGHLNMTGQIVVARELLTFLANLSESD